MEWDKLGEISAILKKPKNANEIIARNRIHSYRLDIVCCEESMGLCNISLIIGILKSVVCFGLWAPVNYTFCTTNDEH